MFYLRFMMLFIITILTCFFFINKLDAQIYKQIKISLLMPFCADEVYKTKVSKNAELSNACLSYYQGLLIAADSLKKAGFKLEINVFDTKKDTVYFKKLLNNENIQNADFIIGPVIKEGQVMMQNFKNKKDAFHLSPLFTFTKTKINDDKSISAYPEMNYYFDYFYTYLKKKEKRGNIVVLVGNEPNDKAMANGFKQLLKTDTSFKVNVIDIAKKDLYYKSFTLLKNNHIVLLSNDENQINAALKTIADTSLYYNTIAYCFKKESAFNTINLEDWLKCNLHLIAPYYVNYEALLTKKFVSTYIDEYATEPNEYAFVGYDQFIYSMYLYEKTKGQFDNLSNYDLIPLLASKYKFEEKKQAKGLQNTYLNILKITETGLQEVNW